MEQICAMVYQLTRNLSQEKAGIIGFDAYYIDHTAGLLPREEEDIPFKELEIRSGKDAFVDLYGDNEKMV